MLQQDVWARLEEGYVFIYQGLFERIMTFQQEVTILSRDTPAKADISPLLPLNGSATVGEKVSSWGKIKMVSELNFLASPCGQKLRKVPI